MVRFTEAQTMTDFMARYGYDTSYMYGYMRYTDPPSDWALFTLKDRLVAWQLLRLLRRNVAMIRNCVRWSPDGQVEVPLTHAEVPLASSALRVLSDQIYDLRGSHDVKGSKGEHVYLLFLAVKEKTTDRFVWDWEESGDRYRDSAHIFDSLKGKSPIEIAEILRDVKPDEGSEYNQSDWPTQWTVEFPLALQEHLGKLERACEMLEAVCGTDETEVRTDGDMGETALPSLMARYGLDARRVDETRPEERRLCAEEVYCAAYLAAALDNLKSDLENGVPYARRDETMRRFFGVGELLYLSLDVLTKAIAGRSKLAIILNAFIGSVFLPMLSHDRDGTYVHLREFGGCFRTRLDRLHRLVRDIGGDLELDLPHEESRVGTDGRMLLLSKLETVLDGTEPLDWGNAVKGVRRTRCPQCGRERPDPSGLLDDYKRITCSDRLTCLALALGARRRILCSHCGEAIAVERVGFTFARDLVFCNEEACRRAAD